MDNIIDTSTISLSLGGVICIIGIFLVKYLLDLRNNDLQDSEKMESTTIWIYSIAAGLIIGFGTLVGYKQYMIYQSYNDILTSGFYE